MAEVRQGGIQRSGSASAKELLETMDPLHHLRVLEVETRGRAAWFLLQAALAGFGKLRVRSGKRGLEEQQRYYGLGRTRAECKKAGVPEVFAMPLEKEVTWVRPEESRHVKGEAFDVDLRGYAVAMYGLIGEIGEECGLVWGGRWEVKDYGHFELPD